MRRGHSRALPIASIDTHAPGEGGGEVGPVVSSAHLAAGRSPALSEVEYGMMIATSAFNRWMVRCMAASGQPGLSATEVAILHSVAHRGRAKRMVDIALVLDIEDIHVVSYAVKKLEVAGLIHTRKAGKEKMVEISDAGRPAVDTASFVKNCCSTSPVRLASRKRNCRIWAPCYACSQGHTIRLPGRLPHSEDCNDVVCYR